jgi:HPt (histidine-containing phosphotransfer) domain-containing protein
MTALPPEVLKQLQEEYLESFPDLLKLMRAALEKSDWKTIEQQFHKFAGSGSTYGLPLITEIARDIESYVIKNVIPQPQLIAELIAKFEQTIENYRNQMGMKN